MIKAHLFARDQKGRESPVSEEFDFLTTPRTGEIVVIIEPERDLTIEVTSVAHLPKGQDTIGATAEVHVWGKILDYGYQA